MRLTSFGKILAPRARFELAREKSHGLSRPAQYRAMRPRLLGRTDPLVFTLTLVESLLLVVATIKPPPSVVAALPLWLRGIASPW